MFDTLFDQKQAAGQLQRILHRGCIPHALLFTGNEAVGKRRAALIFAMACNCRSEVNEAPAGTSQARQEHHSPAYTEKPCGKCRACRKIENASHPDILMVEPVNEVIKIAQIRSLTQALTRKPHEADLRVVIIADAHCMNAEAANALLKALEEPPRHTILILTARQTADLLPTIISRCQHIRFKPVSRHHLQAALMEKRDLDPAVAAMIAGMAAGSLSRALEMSDPQDKTGCWMHRRDWLMNELTDILSFSPSEPDSTVRLLAVAEKLAADKTILPDALDIVSVLLRDLLVCRYDQSRIVNRDLIDRICCVSKRHTAVSLLSKMKAVEKARKAIHSNAVIRLSLEIMMMRLART